MELPEETTGLSGAQDTNKASAPAFSPALMLPVADADASEEAQMPQAINMKAKWEGKLFDTPIMVRFPGLELAKI